MEHEDRFDVKLRCDSVSDKEPEVTLAPPEVTLMPLLTQIFPASASVADAALIDSAEGTLDLSVPDDPSGEGLSMWLQKISSGLAEQGARRPVEEAGSEESLD
ncbi:MAG TPA: hypothetical protein VFY69_11510 [Solirubrobacterales bacterium]|nr:hypothetical protein [Solirubrobacterales bacterium]